MVRKIPFIILAVTFSILATFQAVRAEQQASASPLPAQAIPSQLKPPSEDVAQLDEVIEDNIDIKPYHIPMVLNDSVENHLEYFKTRGHEVFQRWLDRSARYIPIMKDIFREKNLPEDLVYVAMIESGFNPYAVSWAKAVGPWQFMPATGKLYGLRIDWWVDERKDPIKSTQAAAEHLKDLHNLFGSWPLALASYNAGAGKVQRAVLRTRSEDFWDLKASRYIRKETKNYVPKYMAATIIAKNPEAYGFTVSSFDPFKYDETVIEDSTDLRLIAKCANCTYEEIKELNPELRRWITPPQADRYTLRLPSGRKEIFLANYAAIPPEQKIKWERHEVKRGETLAALAKEYNTSPEAICDINGLKKKRITPGKHILIPRDINAKSQELGFLTPGQSMRQQQILYRVRSGETLSRIAKKHNVTVADIREWNKGIGSTVRAGQKIKLVVDVDQI
ncbi:MAG TPA: LysM peptidoglycan-binding domain-containing protein [Nitrospirota bacterium]|nr:LysM peptidoglycan-binding domain-containing protein [Nitrospirota bacterium]